jgi:signal transduction histidine kinase
LLVDEEAGELEVRAARGYLRGTVGKVRFKIGQEGIGGWVAAHKTALNVPDVTQDSRYVGGEETRSEMAVPMMAGDRVIGVLDVQGSKVNAFDDDLRVLSSVAAQAAIAIERARLYSAERRLRATIAEERAKLEAIIRGASDAMFVTNEGGQVLLMNPAAEQAFDVEPGTWVDRPLETVIKDADLLALWRSCSTEGVFCSDEILLDDGRTLYAQLTPVAGVGQMAIMRDITYLKELDKMKSEFVSTVSHDLGSPLQAIQIMAELIPKLGPVNEAQQDAVVDITRMVAKTATLVHDLLDLGKIEVGVEMEMESCQLATVINEAVEVLEERAKAKEIALQITLPQTLPFVMGNPIRLGQVVTNLVGNAIKFTPSGGTVTISAQETEGEVAVEVSDTGIGIAPEDQAHIFDKFYRVKSTQVSGIEGTGLGLAIVKSIVEGHSGRVWVESEPGQGSTFGFALPVAP